MSACVVSTHFLAAPRFAPLALSQRRFLQAYAPSSTSISFSRFPGSRAIVSNFAKLITTDVLDGKFKVTGCHLHKHLKRCNEMAEAFFNNIGSKIESFFGGGDSLPWTDSEMIASCELEASGEKAAVSGENSDSIMRLAWALVHSRNAPDVQRGIAMLEASLAGVGAPMQKREILYLLAVGQFRAGEYARSRRLVDQALKISPDFRQAAGLKKMVEDKIAKDGLVGVGLAAAAVGVVASGIAAAVLGGRRR